MDNILDDKNMIDYCLDKNKKLKEFIDAFGESVHIEKTLSDASKDYLHMSTGVASLFDALKLICIIQPAYYMNWTTVKSMLINEIQVILKEKGAIGTARAKQIETFCLETFYRYMSSVLNKRHFRLFLFFHSMFSSNKTLSVSNTTNKLKKSSKKGTANIELELNPQKMLMLLNEATKHNELQNTFKLISKNNPKPNYISLNSWINCIDLENKLSNVFGNLTKSLRENSKKWLEYFHLDTMDSSSVNHLTQKEIDLLNESPLSADLSLFHKFLLWICIRPDKVFSFC